jgi:hypothetical protein
MMRGTVKNHLLESTWLRMDKARRGSIDLGQLLGVYFPALTAVDRIRVVRHYAPVAPIPVPAPEPVLKDVPGAEAEVRAIFNHWDSDRSGMLPGTT